jgi:hypothetical protein
VAAIAERSSRAPFATMCDLNLALSLERELEGTPIHVGVVTICGPIKAGTFYDPDRLADVYWELATQESARFERDRLVQAPDSSPA